MKNKETRKKHRKEVLGKNKQPLNEGIFCKYKICEGNRFCLIKM